MLVDAFGKFARIDMSWIKGFRRFKCGDFSLEDKESTGQPKKI